MRRWMLANTSRTECINGSWSDVALVVGGGGGVDETIALGLVVGATAGAEVDFGGTGTGGFVLDAAALRGDGFAPGIGALVVEAVRSR